MSGESRCALAMRNESVRRLSLLTFGGERLADLSRVEADGVTSGATRWLKSTKPDPVPQ